MMKKKTGIILLLIILTICTLCALVYFALFSRFILVQDEAWNMIMPKSYYVRLRCQLVKSGYRLKVITIAQDDVFEKEYLNDLFERLDNGGFVLASPVITSAVLSNEINLSKSFEKTTILGIGNNNDNGYFDTVLISNSRDGWSSAASESVQSTDTVAIIYNDLSANEARLISETLGTLNYVKLNVDDYGNFAKTELNSKLNDSKVSVVLCPFVENISEYCDGLNSQKWIIDYRFVPAVNKKNLKGYVYPEIYLSIKSYLNGALFQELPKLGVLQYGYKAVK